MQPELKNVKNSINGALRSISSRHLYLSIDEITNYLSPTISRDEIRQIIDSLSYRFGDLSDLNKDHIFLNNPIHTKPL